MSITEIKLECNDQLLRLLNNPVIASGGINEDRVKFIFCNKWDGLNKTAIFYHNLEEVYEQQLDEGDECFIPEIVLMDPGILHIGVYGYKNGEKRTSSIVSINVLKGATKGRENSVDKAKQEQREIDRGELGHTLSNLTGNDFTNSNWDELMDVTAELPVKTEQDIVDLTGYSELTNAFRQATTAPSLLTGEYNLDKDENEDAILIKLPYLYTPNVKYSENTPISNSVVECGFDVSASGDTLGHYNEVSMFNSTYSSRRLRKLKLTGFECVKYGKSMFMGLPELTELELVEGDNYPEAYVGDYHNQFFRNCRKLQAILGTPLDMSRGTYYINTFLNCESLRHIRFKPGTIGHDLDLSSCSALMKKYESTLDDPGTLVSLVNGVRDWTIDTPTITIKFSLFVKDYLSQWRCEFDKETGLYVHNQNNTGNSLLTILTNIKGVVVE